MVSRVKDSVQCKICNKMAQTISTHVKEEHGLSSKEYYDQYLKKSGEGVCYCGEPTKYQGVFNGYWPYCSIQCLKQSWRKGK